MTDTGATQQWSAGPTATPASGGAPAYAPWEKRAMGYLIDGVLPFVPGFIFFLFVPVLGFLAYLAGLGFVIWNRVQEGNTGQTIGKRQAGTKLVRAADGQYVGAGLAVGRWFLHVLDGIFLIGYLWPLWDEKRQTFADKLVDTVVITV